MQVLFARCTAFILVNSRICQHGATNDLLDLHAIGLPHGDISTDNSGNGAPHSVRPGPHLSSGRGLLLSGRPLHHFPLPTSLC